MSVNTRDALCDNLFISLFHWFEFSTFKQQLAATLRVRFSVRYHQLFVVMDLLLCTIMVAIELFALCYNQH